MKYILALIAIAIIVYLGYHWYDFNQCTQHPNVKAFYDGNIRFIREFCAANT